MNNGNVFVGIIIGLIAAYSYNKFSETDYLWPYHSSVGNDLFNHDSILLYNFSDYFIIDLASSL